MDKRYIKPLLAAVAVYTLWGFSFLAAKVAQRYASPLVLLMYRFDIAALIMAIPLFLRKRKLHLRGGNVKGLLLLGLCEPCIYFIGEQYGLKLTNSAFSGVMIAIIPIVTLIMAAVFLKDRPTKAQWLFSLLSIAGVVAITLLSGGSGEVTLPGVLLLCVAVVTGAAYSVVSRFIADDFTVYERSLIMLIMGAIFYTALAAIENAADLEALIAPARDVDFLLSILYLSVGASVAGYSLFNYAVSNAPMANVTSLCNLTTILSVLAGVIILKEPFDVWRALSLAVILVGIYGVQKTGAVDAGAELSEISQ